MTGCNAPSEPKECAICGKMQSTGINYSGKKGFHCTVCDSRKWPSGVNLSDIGCHPRPAYIIKEATILYDRLLIDKEITGLKAARILGVTAGQAVNRMNEMIDSPAYPGKIEMIKPIEFKEPFNHPERFILRLIEG